jgi:eukaryotic-like serine/threonine-protein kinase
MPWPETLDSDADPDATRADDTAPAEWYEWARVGYFGDYELLGEIARGGMGVVFKARQASLNRTVALKMILSAHLASDAEVQRFRLEAEGAAGLDHPNIVPIYEVGEHRGQHYFTMKLIDGGSLAERLAAGSLTRREAVALLEAIARAVHAAHQRGILHRDLKPANILLDRTGRPHVSDFGLAKRIEGDSGLTQSGAVMGTPSYMAPEQAAGKVKALTTAADVYSLGAILYELLTGRPPFRGDTVMDTLRQVAEREPERPRSLDRRIDRDLETICLKCLDKDPKRRYGSAEALAEDLGRWSRGEPIAARPATARERAWKWARRRPAIAALSAAVVAVAVAGVAGVFWKWREAVANAAAAQESERRANGARIETQKANDSLHVALVETERERLKVAQANKKLRSALEKARLNAYIAHINLAWREWDEWHTSRARELLDGERPKADESDLRGFEWHYLDRLLHSDLLTFRGHAGYVSAVAFSPDSKRIASGSWDQTVKLWDAATGKEALTLRGHAGAVFAVAFSPDGQRIASVGGEYSKPGEVKVWDAATGKEALTLRGHAGYVSGVAFSPDGKRIASAGGLPGKPGEVKVWDAATGQEALTLRGHTGPVFAVVFSPDGKRIASGGWDRMVNVWDAATGQEVRSLRGHTGNVSAVAFSPDSQRIASASLDKSVMLWDAATGREALTLRGHAGEIRAVAFSPDGKRIASAGGVFGTPGEMKVWDTATGQEVRSLRGHTGLVSAVAFSPDGKRIASGSWDQTVKLWDATDLGTLSLRGHRSYVTAVAFSPDGKRIASGSDDATIKLWDAATGREALTLRGHASYVSGVAFSPDGKRFASAGGSPEVVTVPAGSVWTAGRSPDKPGEIEVWDAATGKEALTLRGHDALVTAVAFSPDGKRIASGSWDRTVRVWDAATGREALTLRGHRGAVEAVAFSPDGKRIASGSADRMVKLWDAATGREALTLRGHTGSVIAVAFSPDGTRIASAGGLHDEPGEIEVWDTATGKETLTVRGHTGPVLAVAFSPDGKRIASGSRDRTVKLWDAATGQEALSLRGHAGEIRAVAFSPDGKRIASAGGVLGKLAGDIRLWDAATGQER